MEKRDCFELLSAYLDGEVTATERRQVEEWLSTDVSIKCLYKRLLNLRQGLQSIPVPTTSQSSETTINQVLARVDRRYRLNWTLGGAVVAACILGAISGLFSGNSRMLEIATTQPTELTPTATQSAAADSPLMVALNNPVIEIPKTAVAPNEKPVNNFN
ncbi:zf-HC2 domain-containing protein [Dolichospermum sp. ST_con]|nr:zf-HC2 domain-containing protein [Dolichospermum sp. ST_con]MDD1422227.1 zf-HC2 domain-containing protein [Dolichospermum sp. ST_sed1]MDD1426338.1 zf-HC2 domain-containing protein [Dolichospermum sp. ST_sed9]MDD1434138.1 zf-HC2 domain-containing protein [Dolichospermum sp. ST_sed6]MDD1438236.1 zf-HC2 domain-containing protein [Dolichospermum sp. ST_sed10]MDD1443391.1 zf-HC2 domain-containing protein [Dolichospermum sp. ST_sed3]MDD1449196.1 zf-HC2 domain-containing protein [Dolichospermum s